MGRRSGAQALPRAERLRRASEIQSVFERGSRVESRAFVLLWRPVVDGRKAGFAVSRRVGGAVKRNRVRRRLREAYRQSPGFPADLMLVFVGRPAAADTPFADLLAEMQRASARVEERAGARASLSSSR